MSVVYAVPDQYWHEFNALLGYAIPTNVDQIVREDYVKDGVAYAVGEGDFPTEFPDSVFKNNCIYNEGDARDARVAFNDGKILMAKDSTLDDAVKAWGLTLAVQVDHPPVDEDGNLIPTGGSW